MKKAKIYYGLMGVLKGTTISHEESKNKVDVLRTANKLWKKYEQSIYSGLIQYNDLNLAILHLVRLEEFIKRTNPDQDKIIERGITDYLYYYWNEPRSAWCGMPEDKTVIENSIETENKLLEDFQVERILLVMNDQEFIRTKVLGSKFRNNFMSLDQYLDQQNKYVNFTKTYNKIDQTIEIGSAKSYIELILKDKYID